MGSGQSLALVHRPDVLLASRLAALGTSDPQRLWLPAAERGSTRGSAMAFEDSARRFRGAARSRSLVAMARGGPPSLPEPPGMPEPSKLREHAVAFVRRFFPALLLLLWVRTCVVEPFYIPSVSMYPTLTVNDQIAVEKFSRYWADPSRGDLIVFKAPEAFFQVKGLDAAAKRGGVNLIKRVVAVAGDEVEVSNGEVRINGEARYEPYALEKAMYKVPKLTVPAGCVFVLGDNRNLSVDSHDWGCLPVENVIGKAFYVLFPLERQGFVDAFMQDLEVTRDTGAFMQRLERFVGR
tara:strand:- start:4303 stop:5184 length:882 start_codon:yes stop_codon:yes gene_type:complete